MAEPFNRLRSKLNRAICAYLIQERAGTSEDTFPENSQEARTYPVTTVRAGIATPAVPLTAIRDVTVHITIKGSAASNPSNPGDTTTALWKFEQRLAGTNDLLNQSDDGRTLKATADAITLAGRALAVSDPVFNADMAEFTLQLWEPRGEGDAEPDQEGMAWQEILIFRAICSPSNVD